MQNQQDRIAWIGLGHLGYELTQNLQTYLASQSLPPLAVWNRTAEKSQSLRALFPAIQVAHSIDELFSKYNANVIFTSLFNDAAVEQIYETLISLASKSQHQITFVETGTIFPDLSTRLQKQLSSLPQQHIFLQCPVFGRPEAARVAQMVWVASGDPDAVTRLTPYFNSMSRMILDLKTRDVAAGSTMKLLGNFMLMSTTEMLAESVNLARKSNLDPQHIISFVDAFLPSPPVMDFSRRIVGGAEAPEAVGMTINNFQKDIGTLRRWGQEKGAPLPTADLLYKNVSGAKEKGFTKNWNYMIDSLNSTEHEK